jgi:hypothetical protein
VNNTLVNGVIAVPPQPSLTPSSYQLGQPNCLDGLFVIIQLHLNITTWTEDDLCLLGVQAIDSLLVSYEVV